MELLQTRYTLGLVPCEKIALFGAVEGWFALGTWGWCTIVGIPVIGLLGGWWCCCGWWIVYNNRDALYIYDCTIIWLILAYLQEIVRRCGRVMQQVVSVVGPFCRCGWNELGSCLEFLRLLGWHRVVDWCEEHQSTFSCQCYRYLRSRCHFRILKYSYLYFLYVVWFGV